MKKRKQNIAAGYVTKGAQRRKTRSCMSKEDLEKEEN